ncbi:hypothetical protein WR25_19897 [Diploscapter pachys]|uniref:BRICHOS domain-containing protein n=1 Tax=Diploscapter pachys TaxID=2018661 RepID=A0A2A2LBS0_9BILA|nr:hypothetical protein WR25_19897 [Diploscapter pachys]
MSRMPMKFQPLENEPRARGAPPSYRSHTMTEDSWSDYSASSGMGKKRSSWTNLIDADITAKVHNYNMQQHHRMQAPPPAVASRTSSYSTDIGVVSDIFHQYMPGRTASLTATPPQPAGTLPSHSLPVSRAPSVITNPMPTPQQQPAQSHPSYQQKSQQESRSKSAQKQAKKQKNTPPDGQKRNRLQEMKTWFSRPRNIWCCLLLLMLIAGGIVVAIVLSQVLPLPSEAVFNWQAPGNSTSGGQAGQVRIDMKVVDKQSRFQMQGAPPFKGNFINYYDFNNNQAVIVDDALKSNGRNLYCFVMPINTQAFNSINALRKAAGKSVNKKQMTQGWEQQWNFMANPTQAPPTGFNPPIPECNGARWVTLDYAADQRGRKCTDCFDFCLPEYGVSRDSDSGPDYLNIIRQDCFYLFVPEWRSYAQANNIEQNQRDFEAYYRNRQHMQTGYGAGNQSRWINLSNVPGAISNTASGVAGAIGSGFNNMAQGVQNAFTGGVNTLYPGQSNPSANMQGQGMNSMNSMNSPGSGYSSNQQNGYSDPNAGQQQVQYGQPQSYNQVQASNPGINYGSNPPGGGGMNLDPEGYATAFPGALPRPRNQLYGNDANLRNEWPYGTQSPVHSSDISNQNQLPVSGVVNLNGLTGSESNTQYQTGGSSSGLVGDEIRNMLSKEFILDDHE